MKKSIILILIIGMFLLSALWIKYQSYQAEQKAIKAINQEYETYLNKNITGRELTTAINRAVDNNAQNKIPKDDQGFYVQNDTNSIEIEIKIIDNDTTYKMETLYSGGMENFIQYYSEIQFECTKISYNHLGRVNYILFEQKTT